MSLRHRALAWSLSLVAVLVFSIAPLAAQEAATGQAAQPQAEPEPEPARKGIEEIVVTARKKEESIQDIPIAVSAFSGDDLATSNIDDVADVQFNVPNLGYTKTNFSGAGNISVRGVGNLATAATAEPGTGIHINTAPFSGARIFETEFYDVDRVEILRGPQGTLFGRNAPAGTLNVYTKKPVMEESGGYLQAEYGYYDHMKVRAGLNVPLGEHLAARFAGYWFERDGITHNVSTGNDIDSRDVYAVRASLAGEWDDVDFNLMAQWFEKDDSTMRITNQGCNTDTRDFPFTQGCLGGDRKLRRDPVNHASTLAYSTGVLIDTFHVLTGGLVPRFLNGPISVFTPYATGAIPGVVFGFAQQNYVLTDAQGDALIGPGNWGLATQPYQGTFKPRSIRSVNTQLDPRYWADEFEATLEANWHVTENITLTSVTGWHDASVFSETDYFWADAAVPFAGGPRVFDFTDTQYGGSYDSEFVFDRSASNDEQFTQELRMSTSFDGRFNATVGAIYADGELDYVYSVWGASLESTWDMPFISLLCPAAAAQVAAGASCHDLGPDTSYYTNEGDPVTLESYAVFGEFYIDVFEKTRLTLGARYTDDQKTSVDRVNLWSCAQDPSTPQFCDRIPFGTRTGGWTNVSWKVSLDQRFDLPFAPDSLVYFTASTGYKGGGFNPPVDVAQSGGTAAAVPLEFDEEEITAYEIGYKGILFDQLIFNTTAFYYDYKGMQISKIVNRTAVNENIDSKIYGVELETVWQVSDALRFDFNASWLKTEIQSGQSIDGADPTAGRPGWIVVKQLLNFPAGQNSVCDPSINPLCLDPVVINDPVGPFNYLAGAGFLPAACEGLGNQVQGPQCGYQSDGFLQSLKGKELPNAPAWTLKLGGQYTIPIAGGWDMTPRLDFYWHDEMFGRIYNTTKDEIDSWQQLDAQITITKEGSPWLFEIWGKNLQDNNDITGHYFTDPTSSNFTNLFVLEPRTYGASIRYTWGESEG